MGQILQNQINDTPYMQSQRDAQQAPADATAPQAETLGDALAPVIGLEQGNVELWLQVAQLLVLLMILRRVD